MAVYPANDEFNHASLASLFNPASYSFAFMLAASQRRGVVDALTAKRD